DDAGEQAAGADRRELLRVADQDRLAPGTLDKVEHGREDACLGHPGLVDEEYGSRWKPSPGARLVKEPVECRGGDPGLILELLRRDARRSSAEHRDPRIHEHLPDGMGGGRLAGTGKPDHADDPAWAGRDFADHCLLLIREGDPVGALDLIELL